jgi:hypothetical protein
MRAAITTALLALATLAGCSALQNKPFTCPQKGGAAWTEVKSAHFVLRSDLDRDDAERASAELEWTLAALATLGFGAQEAPPARIEVAYFRREQDARMVLDRLMAGAFYWSGRHDLERTPLAVVYGDFVNATRRTFQHELTHFLVHTYYGNVPRWLDEGLAKYLETLEVDGDKTVVGRAPPSFRFWLGRWKYESAGPQGWFAHIPVGEAVAVADLLKMSPESFYGKTDLDPTTSEGEEAMRAMTTNYASAWGLVHLLVATEAYQSSYEAFVKKIQIGTRMDDAWADSIGLVPADKLESDYRTSLLPRELNTLQFKYDAPRVASESVRVLTDPEVHLLWARLRDWNKDEARAAAKADIEEAAAVAPDLPELSLVKAAWAISGKDFEEAEHVMSRFADSKDPRVLNGAGWTKLQAMSGRSKVQATEIERELGPIAKRLAPVANRAAHFDLLAHYSEAAGDLDGALAHEKRAVALDPQCVACLGFSAHLFDKKGKPWQALDLATFAAGLLPEGTHSSELDSDIAQYRQRITQVNAARKSEKSPAKEEPGTAVPATPKPGRPPTKPR